MDSAALAISDIRQIEMKQEWKNIFSKLFLCHFIILLALPLVPFCAESFVLPSPLQKLTYFNMQNHNFTFCFV